MHCQAPINDELSAIETLLDKADGSDLAWDDVNDAYGDTDNRITKLRSEYNEQLQAKDDHIKELDAKILALESQVGARECWEKEQKQKMKDE